MVEKIRPDASIYTSYGEDGRCAPTDRIEFKCCGCGRSIPKKYIACDRCGIFFDWSKEPTIEVVKQVVWK